MMGDDRLAQRRAAMIATGYWRDKTILDHLDRAIECTPDKTAIVAIRSEGGQEKRHARESGEQQHGDTTPLERVGEQLLHGADFVDRQIAVEFSYLLPDCRDDPERIAGSAHNQAHIEIGRL